MSLKQQTEITEKQESMLGNYMILQEVRKKTCIEPFTATATLARS